MIASCWLSIVAASGLTENAGHKNAGHEIAGHVNAGHENAIHDKYRMNMYYITVQCAFRLNFKSLKNFKSNLYT